MYYEDTHSVIDDIKVCNFQRASSSRRRLPLLFVKLQLQLRAVTICPPPGTP